MPENQPVTAESVWSVPEQGQLVEVRRRQWVVAEIDRSSIVKFELGGNGGRPQHLLTLKSVDEDAIDEECRVIWEIEPGARILERAGLPKPTGFDDPRRLDAFLDAVRWGAATNADVQALQAPFRSGIAIEDYQLDPVVRALQMTRVNLLIADDVGLGKTIEAGLVIQELLLRHRARTVLVVCPASLQLKWQTEMREKFGLEFRIVDTSYLRALRRARGINANPWTSFPRLITSMDWVKGDIPMRYMRDVVPVVPTYPRRFDVLLIDEAHNVAPSGQGNYAIDSLRTRAIRSIGPHFEHRLFLTATPHNGFQESFTALLELLDNQRFARGVPPDEDQKRAVVVRRLKTDIVDETGKKRFPERRLEPLEIQYTEEERRIHQCLSGYTALRQAAAANGEGRNATEFVLKLLKKRLFSSPAAFAATLEKHRDSLAGKKSADKKDKLTGRILRRAIQKAEEEYADDEARDQAEREALTTAAPLLTKLSDEEKKHLGEMTKWAESAKNRPDSKARALLEWLRKHVKPSGEWSKERVIIFTEYRATQKWLIDILTNEGFGGPDRLVTIYGGMDTEKREAVKAAFQTDPDKSAVRILVATDAASEGIDLQNHCRMLIHAEIPWNPNVLEQRNGRIDRHGQKSDEVFIWHPVGKGYSFRGEDSEMTGDLEGDLEFLMVAVRKIDRMRIDLGKVGPVIATQVEQAMLGRRNRLDTARAEREAREVRKQLAVELQIKEKVKRLHEKLMESKETFRMCPENIRNTVQIALEIAGLPALKPVDHPGLPRGTVFRMPAFQGTWARCTEGLNHPYTNERRPITFDHAVAKGRDDVVLVHLNHRLVQMCLRLLRAEVWALDDVKKMHRTAVKVVPGGVLEHPAAIVWMRLVVTGAKGHRLHEELTHTGGILRDGRFARLNMTEIDKVLKASQNAEVGAEAKEALIRLWPKLEEPLWASIRAREKERMSILRNTLDRRCGQDIKDIEKILRDLLSSIEEELGRPDPDQLAFWPTEEQEQLRKNKSSLQDRIAMIPKEIEKESKALRERYAEPVARSFPVAITFLVPENTAGRRA